MERCSFTVALYRCYQYSYYIDPTVSANRGFQYKAPGLSQRSKRRMPQAITGRAAEHSGEAITATRKGNGN